MPATDLSNPLVRYLVATVMLLAAWGAAVARADDRYLSEEGRFRIAFPAAPREEALDKAGHHRRAHAEVDGLTYLVDWADLAPEVIRKAGDEQILLHRLRDGLAAGKTVIGEKSRTIGGCPGLELVIDDGAGGRRIYHVYKVGPRLYTVGVGGRVERLRTQQPLLERFLESFSVRTVPPRKLGPLAVKAAEPRFGRLGPPRRDWRFLPYDVLTARLSLVGLATDDEGHYDVEATTEVLAADGEVVAREPYRLRGVAIDEILPLDILQQLPVKEGTYRLRVSLHDVRSGDKTVWEQPFTRLPPEPALVAAACRPFGYDDRGLRPPAAVRPMTTVFPAERILLGPGPSPVSARVLRALAAPTLGHLDPQYLAIMDETCEMLRRVFRTRNPLTFPVSGTGMAGMECLAVNLLEPGDEAIVCTNGVFGGRMKDVMERCGATVHAIEAPWGETIPLAAIAAALDRHPQAKVFGIVHAETSTGAHQPLDGIADLVHAKGALFLVDAVTSLGGHELEVDAWGIDAIYSGTQKCLSCPPGLSPVSFGDRALAVMDARKSKVQSWYLDVSMLRKYYTGGGGGGRVYHHTAPINMTYALHEALTIVLEEGLEARWARHAAMHRRLRAGLESLGIRYVPARSLHTLNCIHKPEHADDAAVRRRLLEEYGIEIGAGLGVMAGKAWRIGLMGHGATVRNVDLVLAALREVLRS